MCFLFNGGGGICVGVGWWYGFVCFGDDVVVEYV